MPDYGRRAASKKPANPSRGVNPKLMFSQHWTKTASAKTVTEEEREIDRRGGAGAPVIDDALCSEIKPRFAGNNNYDGPDEQWQRGAGSIWRPSGDCSSGPAAVDMVPSRKSQTVIESESDYFGDRSAMQHASSAKYSGKMPSELAKQKLQHTFEEHGRCKLLDRLPTPAPAPAPKYVDPLEEEFDELQGEIQERQRYLDSMAAADKQRYNQVLPQMKAEISVRAQRLRVLDRQIRSQAAQ